MALNKYYTQDEDRRLLKLKEDFPEMSNKDLAQKAIDYGICTDRNVNGVSKHIYALTNPKPVVKRPEQIKEDDVWTSDRDLYITAKKYESLLDTIFDNATLWTGAYEDGLFFNIPSLRAWLKEYEKDRFNDKIIELLDAPRPTYSGREYTTATTGTYINRKE